MINHWCVCGAKSLEVDKNTLILHTNSMAGMRSNFNFWNIKLNVCFNMCAAHNKSNQAIIYEHMTEETGELVTSRKGRTVVFVFHTAKLRNQMEWWRQWISEMKLSILEIDEYFRQWNICKRAGYGMIFGMPEWKQQYQ